MLSDLHFSTFLPEIGGVLLEGEAKRGEGDESVEDKVKVMDNTVCPHRGMLRIPARRMVGST